MYIPTSETTSIVTSLGVIALAGYVSSPTSSSYSFDSLPELIGYSQTQTQIMTSQDIDGPEGDGSRTLWLKKPQLVKYGASPKIK